MSPLSMQASLSRSEVNSQPTPAAWKAERQCTYPHFSIYNCQFNFFNFFHQLHLPRSGTCQKFRPDRRTNALTKAVDDFRYVTNAPPRFAPLRLHHPRTPRPLTRYGSHKAPSAHCKTKSRNCRTDNSKTSASHCEMQYIETIEDDDSNPMSMGPRE